MHLKMSSAEVVCCKKMHNITDELSIEASSVDPEQTAPFSRREKQTTCVVIGALRVKYVFKMVSLGSKDCIKELKLECAYFLGQTS